MISLPRNRTTHAFAGNNSAKYRARRILVIAIILYTSIYYLITAVTRSGVTPRFKRHLKLESHFAFSAPGG